MSSNGIPYKVQFKLSIEHAYYRRFPYSCLKYIEIISEKMQYIFRGY